MRIPPPDVLAQWPTPNYVNPESRGPGLTIIELIMLPLSLMFLGLRLYVRGHLLRKTGWDDWFMVIASIFGTTVSICVILAYTTFGWDKHIWDLTVTEISHGRKISMATQAVFIMSSCFSKVSILVSYLALAPMDSWFRRLTKVSMVFIIAMNCGSFILLFTQCHPVSSYWSLIQSNSTDCIQEYAPLMTHAIVTALADFIVWVLPLPTFFRAHIPIHQRIILVVLFSFGLLVVFAACIRMYWVHYVVWETWDPTWEGNQLWAWTAVEIHLGIMCGCVPYFKSLFRFWKGKTSRRGTSNKGTAQSWAGSRRDGGGGAGVGGSSKIGDEQQRQGQNSRVEVRKVISFSSERSEEPLSPTMGTACTVSVDGVEEIELQEKRTSAFSTVSREVEDQKGGHAHQGEWGFEFDGARGVQHSKSLSAGSTFGNKVEIWRGR